MSLSDIERPLNSRGMRDAPFMAAMLSGRGVTPDQIISSPANRALTTASYFAEELRIKREDILVKREIYEAWPEDILNIVQSVDEQHKTILLFGHNPSLTSIANLFSREYIANVPTCGIIQVESQVEQWALFRNENAKVAGFHFPKQYFS